MEGGWGMLTSRLQDLREWLKDEACRWVSMFDHCARKKKEGGGGASIEGRGSHVCGTNATLENKTEHN